MASGYLTSERICRVITKNFKADHELQEKLDSIERKKRKASVQLNLTLLEIHKELENSPVCNGVPVLESYPTDPPPSQNRRVFVLSGSTIPAERKRRNMRSYNELLQKLEPKTSHMLPNLAPRIGGPLEHQDLTPMLVGRRHLSHELGKRNRSPAGILSVHQPVVTPYLLGGQTKYSYPSLSKISETQRTAPEKSKRVEFKLPSASPEVELQHSSVRTSRNGLQTVNNRKHGGRVNYYTFPSLRSSGQITHRTK